MITLYCIHSECMYVLAAVSDGPERLRAVLEELWNVSKRAP